MWVPSERTKQYCPSLGDFIPLLLVSKAASWPAVRGALIREVLARNVWWACRGGSALLARLDESSPSTEERLRLTWDATLVSNRLLMTQSLFVSMARRDQSVAQTARVLDRLYGMPSTTMVSVGRPRGRGGSGVVS